MTFRYRRSGPDIVSSFSWDCPPGRTALLGPNGAGKSTLLAIAADAFTPRAGRVVVNGISATGRGGRRAYRTRTGWMPQHSRPVPGLSVREQVAYAGWLKGMPSARAWDAALSALSKVGLEPLHGRPSASLSGGQMRRVGIAQALVHEPATLLLDEPTAGLDPGQRAHFREVLQGLSGTQDVLVSTHQVDDIGETFDHVAVLAAGELRFAGTVADFLALAPAHATAGAAEAAYAALVERER
ncbi:MAG: ATP-binding cassette domain-containing protein [Dehalococcoidia bacterium]|nr:ATP-binding cassette domain-containing protein [Dehalococcoidia bacterium]